MATLNVSKYQRLGLNIENKVDEMMVESIALPIILGDVFNTMVHQYNVAESDIKAFKSYVDKKVYEKYLSEVHIPYEQHIDWDTIHGAQLMIWKNLVKQYYAMASFEDAVEQTCKAIMKKYNIPSKCTLWIGVYIREVADIIFFDDTDCGLEAMLYEGFDLNDSTYKGIDLTTNQNALSPCAEGVVNDDNEIVAPFAPDTVEMFMDIYDSMTWDIMPDDYKEILLQKYDIPDYMIRTFAETWRGVPIFTHDIIVTTVYDENDNHKGDIILTHVLMGEEILTLILQNDNNVIIQEDDIQFSMNIGSLHDHPEMMEMYERALSAAIMNNNT